MNNKKELIDLKKRYYGNNSNNINNNISNSISYSAFSLVEISISLIVIAIILAALSPIITKRLTSTSTQKNKISTNCSSYFPQASGYCAMCYINPKKCIICTRSCNSDEFKNVDNCICESCRTKYNDSHCSRCNSQRCLQCDQGYYLDNNNKCTICPKGYYCYQDNSNGINGDGGVSVKKPCPKGYAAPNEGMSSCNPCAKSTNTIQGSVAINEGSVNCTLCNNGYYASISSQTTSCNICPKGYYCPSGKIIECPKGTANNQTGRYTICDSCIKSTSAITGTYATSTKQTLCSSCTNGNYASIDKQSSYCNTCPGGYYCPNGKIIKCPQGTYSTGGAVSCIMCPGGTTSNTGASSCVSCSSACLSCYTTSTNCTSCKAGYYKSGNSCKQCAVGYYSNANATSCIKCASGYYSLAGASGCSKCSSKFPHCKVCDYSKCTECEEGYKLNDKGECEKAGCPAKTIKINTGGKTLCVTQYNMGDQSEFPLSGVTTVKHQERTCDTNSKCCWIGIPNACNSDNGNYSGCKRTVCNYAAAKKLCSNLNYDNRVWRMPTGDEADYFASNSISRGNSGLMLCDDAQGYDSAYCDKATAFDWGGNRNNVVTSYPYIFWYGDGVYPHAKFLREGELSNEYFYNTDDRHARSVRCVTELEEE